MNNWTRNKDSGVSLSRGHCSIFFWATCGTKWNGRDLFLFFSISEDTWSNFSETTSLTQCILFISPRWLTVPPNCTPFDGAWKINKAHPGCRVRAHYAEHVTIRWTRWFTSANRPTSREREELPAFSLTNDFARHLLRLIEVLSARQFRGWRSSGNRARERKLVRIPVFSLPLPLSLSFPLIIQENQASRRQPPSISCAEISLSLL